MGLKHKRVKLRLNKNKSKIYSDNIDGSFSPLTNNEQAYLVTKSFVLFLIDFRDG